MAPTPQVLLRLDTKESSDLYNLKDTKELVEQPQTTPPTSSVENESLLDDIKEPLRLPTYLSYFAAGVTLLIYGWALSTLFIDYQQNYFHKVTAPSAVKNYLIHWSPTFLMAIVIEFIYGKYKKSPIYPPGDSLASFCVFVARTVTTKLTSMTLLCYGLYGVVWHHYGYHVHNYLFPEFFKESALIQFLCIVLLDDFIYYWVHRTGHTVNALWAVHSTHHNGEFYNLMLALRNSLIVRFVTILYYLPLALFFEPPVWIMFRQFNLVYQFWLHTEAIGKLGWLEYIFNTPSQHRVHHGRNAYCIDKNFGGMLCIFDRFFGTFQEELEEVPVVYGLTTSLETYDPWRQNFQPMINIWKSMKTVKGWDKVRVLYKSPGWVPGTHPAKEYPIPPCTRKTFQQFKPKLPVMVFVFLFIEVFILIVAFRVQYNSKITTDAMYWYFYGLCAFSVFGVHSISAINDRRAHACWLHNIVVFVGAFVFTLGAYLRYDYNYEIPTAFSRFLTEVSVYWIVALVLFSVMFIYREAITKPLGDDEIAKDAPHAAAAEKAQWEFYTKTKALQKAKAD